MNRDPCRFPQPMHLLVHLSSAKPICHAPSWTLLALAAVSPAIAETTTPDSPKIKGVVRSAFTAVHDGWSTDEVLLQDNLNRQFIAACRRQLPDVDQASCNWILLNLRKAGSVRCKGYEATPRSARRLPSSCGDRRAHGPGYVQGEYRSDDVRRETASCVRFPSQDVSG